MDMETILNFLSDAFPLEALQAELPTILTFLFFLLLALVAGRYTPNLVGFIIRRFFPNTVSDIYRHLIQPLERLFRITGTFILVSLTLVWLEQPYPPLYAFLRPFADLSVIMSAAWLASRVFQRVVRVYGIEMLRKMGREIDDLLLVFETLANVIIVFIAILAFAQSQQFNLVGLLASFGLGGLAVAFAAQKILEQLLSTIVIYLDQPFTQGDYIRLSDGQLGRVESIGIRSTKIRTAAKATVLVVPNSNLVGSEIENLTLAKKVMVMLYLDFKKPLNQQDEALVRQVISDGTNSLFGIDPGSTDITFLGKGNNGSQGSGRARVSFFILGSRDNSIELRKRLLELANEKISTRLEEFGIQFRTQDPTIYVDAPVTV